MRNDGTKQVQYIL